MFLYIQFIIYVCVCVCVCAGLTYCAMFQAFQEAVTEVVLLPAKTEAECQTCYTPSYHSLYHRVVETCVWLPTPRCEYI